jgi:hypothetical protein
MPSQPLWVLQRLSCVQAFCQTNLSNQISQVVSHWPDHLVVFRLSVFVVFMSILQSIPFPILITVFKFDFLRHVIGSLLPFVFHL